MQNVFPMEEQNADPGLLLTQASGSQRPRPRSSGERLITSGLGAGVRRPRRLLGAPGASGSDHRRPADAAGHWSGRFKPQAPRSCVSHAHCPIKVLFPWSSDGRDIPGGRAWAPPQEHPFQKQLRQVGCTVIQEVASSSDELGHLKPCQLPHGHWASRPQDSLRKQGSNKCETAQIWAFQAVFREI